jgi:glucosyl-3-phosphoglycerate phosphatase
MILLRHGQSEFNLLFTKTRQDPGIADPKLTELGHLQAQRAVESLKHQRIARMVASPYTRALQTAAPIAQALGVPVFINSAVRERFAFTCDIGTPRTELAQAWPDHDFLAIDEIWWPASAEPENAVIGRAHLFRAEMAALTDWSDTLVVSHWGFILACTGTSVMNGEWVRHDPSEPPVQEIVWRP